MSYIAEELADFFQTGKNKIEPINSKDNNILGKLLTLRFLPVFLFLFFSGIVLKINNYTILAKITFLITLLLTLLCLLTIIVFWIYQVIKYLQINPIEDLHKYHNNNFNKIIEKLSKNGKYKNLKKEEILLKIGISKGEIRKERIRVLSPSITLLIVIFTVIYFGISNEQLEFKLYGVISVVGLVTAVVALIFQLMILFLNQKISVYKESLIILQEALTIAKEQENSNHSRHRSDTVVLSRAEYEELIEELEELDDLRAYTEAIRANDEAIPFEQAIAEIEENRQ